MADENIKNETNASVDANKIGTPSRDTTLDVSSLLKASKEAPEKKETALDKFKREKEERGSGLVVENKALEEANKEKTLIANKAENDAMDEVDEYLAEQDKMIQAAQNVKFDRLPQTGLEMAAAMDAIEEATTSKEVMNGEKVKTVNIETQESGEKSPEEVTSSNEATAAVDEDRKNIINILIDKTGLGGDFKFTDEEKEKIFSSTEIHLKEVEELDLSTITVKKAEKSFLESVNEFQISSSKVPVVFPASRFKAYMTGLSYGEMGDISLNNENVTFDQLQKKLTVIYNKMVNPSIGEFENFEDFLKKFAYVDIDLAVYGLVVATFPEIDDIPLTCNNEKCKNSFNHKYSPRTLIRFDKANEKFLNAMKDVVECPAAESHKLLEESPARVHKRVKLPFSGFIIEIGIASAYDYLYTIVDNIIGDKFKDNHPDDVNGILQINATLLGLIRAVYVPSGDGSYTMFDNFEDMINALYMVKPEEISILASLLQKYTDSYTVEFELFDITCPHCGTKTSRIPLDINSLVFLKYQRLMSTEIDINNISVL